MREWSRILAGHGRRLLNVPLAGRTLRAMEADPDPVVQALAHEFVALLGSRAPADYPHVLSAIEQSRTNMLGDWSAVNPKKPSGPKTTNTIHHFTRVASKRRRWALALHAIVRAVRPQKTLEFGTCLGISAGYIAAAKHGHVWSLDRSPGLLARAKANLDEWDLLDRVTLVKGDFGKTLGPLLQSEQTFDLVFKDGQHERAPTLQYFHDMQSHLNDGAVLVFDDITWSTGMNEAWLEMRNHRRVAASIDLFNLGILVLRDEAEARRDYTLGLP